MQESMDDLDDSEHIEEIDLTDDSSQSSTTSGSQEGIGKGSKHGGRVKDTVWGSFDEVIVSSISYCPENGRLIKMQKCQQCGKNVSPKACRMNAHLTTCTQQRSSKARKATRSSQPNISTTGEPPKKQLKLSGFPQSTSKEKKSELDKLVATFWYSANLPCSTANLNTWKELCKALLPGYQPPSEDTLSDTQLNTTYDELHNQMLQDLSDKSGTLVQDGWSDIYKAPTLTHTIVCDGDAYLLNSIECNAELKTSEYCAAMFEEAMTIADAYQCTVTSGTTDNCPVMTHMRELLKEKYPTLLFYGCSPHLLNKLCEDVTNKIFIAKINEVSKFFSDHHRPAGLLKEKGGLIPQLPATTRWSSHLECVRVFIKNRTKYIDIAQIDGVCPNNISETVNSLSIFKNAQDLLVQMVEITAEVLKLQSDKSNIADSLHSWLILLQSPTLRSYKQKVRERMELACEDFFYVAYFFHPKYGGSLMKVKDKEKCFEILLEIDPLWIPVAQAFEAKNPSTFPKSCLHEAAMSSSDPEDWWSSLKGNLKIPIRLIEYLLPMYRCPASTASVERVFSTYGYVQTDVRDRLTQDKVMKLSFCFRALRHNDDKKRKPRNMLTKRASTSTPDPDAD